MSMSKNIARLAVTAGLTAALSFGGVMAPVTMAFADGATATTNIITINNIGDNQDATYKAYQIFKATVTDDQTKGKIAQNIEWANTELGNKVINAIEDWSRHNASSVGLIFLRTPRLRMSPNSLWRTRVVRLQVQLTELLRGRESPLAMFSMQLRMS